MNTPFLFVATVLIWGTTWIAIAAQVGEVAVTVSIFYRFALASVVMLAGLAALGRLRWPARWRFVVVQALCLFCFNFIGIYMATSLIPSGLVSVIFSLASILNAINARLFFGDPVDGRTILAGSLGVGGLVLLFWNDVAVAVDPATLRGIAWAFLGTMLFSLGNMASRRNSMLGVAPVTANAWGMAIGALCLLLIVTMTGQPLGLPMRESYWIALAYLGVIGSVIGFTTYLMLISRIGSARAGYATVLFPIVALTASTMLEDYQWTAPAILGVALACAGNVVMFRKG
ncbi:DMT family transporter [Profundibacterium mesophilum]|uniref:Membrane protein n=1 Tax=Profundibacterium mesophilum KAUST100406-0324 TaxID=1037889 RepID=A0A921NRN2_9RHOB|nr:DMT family transporter [Profundibacterium mesophilum]KAF0677452.1 putative membrane protein [Profundibacterium mesophilum KAUST100406-0324]